ncbi:MAG TPA: hypothetical protein ENI27_04315 [bacterium]|nr:hypothetical protein [bacterium]
MPKKNQGLTVIDEPLPEPKVEVLEDEESSEGLPVYYGHQVTQQQWDAFDVYCRASRKNGVQAALRAAEITQVTFWRWRRSKWWAALFDEYMGGKLQDFHKDLLAESEVFSKALIDVAGGKRAIEESPNASVNAALGFAKMGPAPLIDNRSQVNLQQNFNQTNIEKADILVLVQNMTQEQLLEFNTTGKIPAGVSPKVIPNDHPTFTGNS